MIYVILGAALWIGIANLRCIQRNQMMIKQPYYPNPALRDLAVKNLRRGYWLCGCSAIIAIATCAMIIYQYQKIV